MCTFLRSVIGSAKAILLAPQVKEVLFSLCEFNKNPKTTIVICQSNEGLISDKDEAQKMNAAGDRGRQNSLRNRDTKRMRLTPLREIDEILHTTRGPQKFRNFTISSFFGDEPMGTSNSRGDSRTDLLLNQLFVENRICE